MYGSNFIKQHSESVMVCDYQNADCSVKKQIYGVIYCDFRHTFVPYMNSGVMCAMSESCLQPPYRRLNTDLISRTSRETISEFTLLGRDYRSSRL